VSSEAIKKAIDTKATVNEIRAMAFDAGVLTLAQDGVLKALSGRTDLRQVLAVCSR
jgi:type II secretory ATPase GspE/PulE/Tfp pilus assembly ATPase PilB-like protein